MTQFYRGVVAHAFNDNDGAIAALAPLLDSLPRGFSRTRIVDATDALGDSYRRVYRYRESAVVYRRALAVRGPAIDTAARGAFTRWALIGDALAEVPPQRITWTAESNGAPVANDSVAFAMVASINDRTAPVRFGIDAGAALSTIDSTTAATHSVRLLGPAIATTIAGRRLPARLGVIGSLDIGPATLSNVIVSVVHDDSLQSVYNS